MSSGIAPRVWPTIAGAIVVLLTLAAVVATYPTFSSTYDEPAHIATGLELLDKGTYYYEQHHPPLARAAIALGPYLAGLRSAREYLGRATDPSSDFWLRMAAGFDEGRRILYEGGFERVLTLARIGVLPFLALALIVTYGWARSLLGAWPAVLAVLLLATVPTFLGNAGIATLDIPVTALCVAAMLAFCHWLDRPGPWAAVALGVASGAAIMSKFSAIPFLGASFLVLIAWRAWLAGPQRDSVGITAYARSGALAASVVLIVCWAAYGFGFTSLANPANRPYEAIESLLGRGSVASNVVSNIAELPLVPAFLPHVAEGIRDVLYHNRLGHRSYLLGEIRSYGWWYYYFVALGVKTPLPLLIAGVGGMLAMLVASVRRRDWRIGAPALGIVAVLGFASVYSSINLGVRHVLIVYPLLAICAAYALLRLAQAIRPKALAAGLAAAVVIAQAAIAVRAYPDFMAYFNTLAGPSPERVLMPIDVDWGQDLKRLEVELRKRGVDRVAVNYFGSADLNRHDLPGYSPLMPFSPQTGWIAVSLWKLTRDNDHAWLAAFQPVARIGTSINLYHITDEAAVARLAPTIVELAPGVYLRDKKRLHGSQQAFIEFDSYVVVFDPSTVIQARQLLADIRARTSKPIRYVVISHFHPDHSAGAAVFAQAGAQVVAAAAARPDFEGWVRRDFAGKLIERPAEYRGLQYVPPSRYLDAPWVLDDGRQRLEVIPVGHGHTSGDLVGWMPKDRILFVGDLATDGRLNLSNANLSGWIAIVDRLKALDPKYVVVGHGPLAGPEALERSRQMLSDLRSKVRDMVARGLTFEEIAAWYTNTPARPEIVDVQLAYAEAGGVRQHSQPERTRAPMAWAAAAFAALIAVGGFYWRRRRRAGRATSDAR